MPQWKLEAHIKKGVFVRSKVYYYEDVNGSTKKVCAGVNAADLSVDDYLKLGKGEEIQVKMPKITVDWKKLEIRNILQEIRLEKK